MLRLPIFDYCHPASVLTGAAHPICIDSTGKCSVDYRGMSPQNWLALDAAAGQAYQAMRFFQFAFGFFKATHRVNHTFTNGTVAPVDLMLSELLEWHQQARSGAIPEGQFPPLLRVMPFHLRRRSSEEEVYEGAEAGVAGIHFDSATLRYTGTSRDPGSEWTARIWLRAHGRDATENTVVNAWESVIHPALFDRNFIWKGNEPRFVKATLPADRYYG